MKKTHQYSIKINDVRKNVFIGKVSHVKLGRGKLKEYDYFTTIELKGVELIGKEDEYLYELLEKFSIVIISNQNGVIGEHVVYGERDSIKLSYTKDGKKDIWLKVKMEDKLTNPMLKLWTVWDACSTRNMWGEWPINKKRQWVSLCYNHQLVRQRYYEDSIYYRKKVDKLYLDGTYIKEFFSFHCALGEAFWGPKGFYGGMGMNGYAYLHDSLGMSRYTTVYWKNFRATEDVFLLYFIHLLINEAGTKLILEPKAPINEQAAEEIYLDGTHVVDTSTFFKALGEALAEKKSYIAHDLESFEEYLKKESLNKKNTVIKWINYQWIEGWDNRKSDEQRNISKCMQLLSEHGVKIIFLPLSLYRIQDVKQLVTHAKNKNWAYQPLVKYTERMYCVEDPFMMELLGLSSIDLERIMELEYK